MNSEGDFRRYQLKYPHGAAFVIKYFKKRKLLSILSETDDVSFVFYRIESFQDEIKSQFDQMTV